MQCNILGERFSNVNDVVDGSVNQRLNFILLLISSQLLITQYLELVYGNWKIKSIDLRFKEIIISYILFLHFVHNDFLHITAEIGIFGD